MNEVVREFLLESHENLAQLDLDLVTLEKEPQERETLARVFRTLHTVKGTAGFLGLPRLQAVAHAGENLLSKLRAGDLVFNPEIASALLAVVDALRHMLAAVEVSAEEGDNDYSPLIRTLETLTSGTARAVPSSPTLMHARPSAESILRTAGPATMVPTFDAPPPPLERPAAPPAPPPQPEAARPAPPPPPPEPEPPRPAPDADLPRATTVSDSAIRVDVGLLDKLMTLVGELVLARNQIMQFSTSQEDSSFLGTVQRLNLLTTELQANVMKTRMQPIANVWSKYPRVVRDLAVACGKQVRIELEGQETELDKTILEAIRDPLTHLVRNAVDHGIEKAGERAARGKNPEGRLLMHAFHEGGKVIIEMSDDGGGIDPARVRDKALQAKLLTPEQADRLNDQELVNLVFLPGFSTTDRVTQFSGRGVGMDVVRTNIEKIGGTVNIESRVGRGTTVKMKIPLTLAIIPALTITSGGDRYAIPQVSLLELVRLEGEQAQRSIEMIHGAPVYRLRGNLLPLVYLNRVLKVESQQAAGSAVNIVVLQADDRQFGLVVDAIHDTEEIVVKPLQKQIKGINSFAGATIMGDGKVALILDVVGLAQRAHVVSGVRERGLNEKTASASEMAAERETVLLFSTTDGGRLAIPLSMVARLEEFPRSALERTGRQEVVQYRNEILPLIHVSRMLRKHQANGSTTMRRKNAGKPRTEKHAESDTVQVVVYAGESQRVGLVVHRILDIVEESLEGRTRAKRPGVLFSAVVQGRVTEFLDVEGIIRLADPTFFEDAAASSLASAPARRQAEHLEV